MSPFLLNGRIRHHLATFTEADPEFVSKMDQSFYINDKVSGDGTTDRAFDLFSKAKVRMANGGFRLHKRKTNDPKLKERISATKTIVTKQETVKKLEREETYPKSKLECQRLKGRKNSRS